LSRAARLVGVSRGALQKRIQDGELPTFEGMVSADDLVKAYPQTRFEDNTAFERLQKIKEAAFAQRLRERILPDAETLAARLTDLGRELAETRAQLAHYRTVTNKLQQHLHELEQNSREAPAAIAPLLQWLQWQLAQELRPTGPSQEIEIRDSFLRVMAAHIHLLPSQHEFFVEGNDTLLDAALHAGLALNYGCSNGNCGLCKAKVLSGQTKKLRAHDYVLTEAEKSQGFVLLCSHTAVSDLVLEAVEAANARDIPLQKIATRVKHIEALSPDMLLLHVQTPRTNRLRFLAGQSVRLSLNGAAGEHPIASCPCDDRNIQFHVRRVSGDAFSDHVYQRLKPMDVVALEGPRGEFLLHEDSPRPLIFIAYEVGFAPIKSLIEHAMALDVAENVYLYWIARTEEGHYLQNLCRAWNDALDNFHYTPLLAPANVELAIEKIAADHPDLGDFDVYAAGPEPFLAAAHMVLRERGLPPDQLTTGRVD
jgi:CDP-4-dehydro-6-deoxyglucose reductase